MGVADALRALTDAELASLFRRRPDLLTPPPGSMADLASRASAPYSLQACLALIPTPVRDVVDALVYLGEPATVEQIAAIAAEPPDIAALTAAVDDARCLGLLGRTPHGSSPDVWAYSVSAALRRMIPAPFGLRQPAKVLLDRYTMPDLRMIALNLGLGDRREAKTPLVNLIATHLGDPVQVLRMLERAPGDALMYLERMMSFGGIGNVETSPYDREELPDGLRWLFGTGMIAPLDWETAVVLREVAVALHGGSAVRSFRLAPPVVPEGSARLGSVVEMSASGIVDLVGALGLELSRSPIASLKSGGVGVKELKATAKRFGIDENSMARVFELAGIAGLLSTDLLLERVLPLAEFETWLARSPLDRWRDLVRSWQLAPTTLIRTSQAGARLAPLAPNIYGDDDHVWRRGYVMQALREKRAYDMESLTTSASWPAPGRFASSDRVEAVEAIVAEAALLGLLRDGSISQIGEAALFGSEQGLELAAVGVFPVPQTTFTVQADLTALAPQELDATVAAGLAGCAELTSRGAASLFRFTDVSLRRAFDAGETSATLLEFLESHARPDVPQPLRYLVEDVWRRYGGVRVGSASSYVRVDDAALLAEIVRSKKTTKLKLQVLAPTVAASPVITSKLMAGLRDAGFLPVQENADGTVLSVGRGGQIARMPPFRRPARPQAAAAWAALTDSADPEVLGTGSPIISATITRLRATDR